MEDLKHKGLIMSAQFTQAQATAPRFLDTYVKACTKVAPLNRFLAQANGLTW